MTLTAYIDPIRVIEGLGMSRNRLKDRILNIDPFRILKELRKYAELNVGEDKMVDLSRGSPHPIFSSNSFESEQIFTYVTEAAAYIAKDATLREKVKASQDIQTIEDIIKDAYITAQKQNGKENAFGKSIIDFWQTALDYTGRLFGLKTSAEQRSDNLHRVIDHLVTASGIVPQEHSKFGADLIKGILGDIRGTRYGDITGLDAIKLYFSSIMKNVEPELEKNMSMSEETMMYKRFLITQGVSQGIDTFFKSDHFNEGDYVIVTTPFYPPYQLLAKYKKLKIIVIPTDSAGRLDIKAVEALQQRIAQLSPRFKHKIKALITIDPSNPSGRVFSHKEKAKLAEFRKLAPNLIFCEDAVYKLYANSEFRHFSQVDKDAPVMTFYSVSKAEKFAGLRVGGMYVNRAAEIVLRKQGVLKKIVNVEKSAFNYFAEQKGGPAYHTNQSATTAQIKAALCSTHDLITGNMERFSKEKAEIRQKLFELFQISPHDRIKGSNYYFWLNVHEYIRMRVLSKPGYKLLEKQYILENLDVPEILLRAIEMHGIVLFDGASFFPKTQMPYALKIHGAEGEPSYQHIYDSIQKTKPEMYLRGALPNADSTTVIDAYTKLKAIIDERVEELSKHYMAKGSVTRI